MKAKIVSAVSLASKPSTAEFFFLLNHLVKTVEIRNTATIAKAFSHRAFKKEIRFAILVNSKFSQPVPIPSVRFYNLDPYRADVRKRVVYASQRM